MTYITIGDRLIKAVISGALKDLTWDDRDTKTIRTAMTFEEASALFVDGLEWSIVYVQELYDDKTGNIVQEEPEIYDNSDYCVAGDITDHRDGTVSVKMGKITDGEALAELMEVLNG